MNYYKALSVCALAAFAASCGTSGVEVADGQTEEFEKVYELNQAIGLPVSLKDIEITEEQWEESMTRIPEMSDVAHYPYKVTREMLENAMNQLKNYSKI